MTVVDRRAVAVGPLVAEGGEGKVHEIVGRPDLLYKAYRRPVPADHVTPLLRWREALDAGSTGLGRRLTAAASWPSAVVVDRRASDDAVGLLLPRAPERFSVRHKDGVAHLATLSYLTADPRQRSAAYGLQLPPPVSVDRLALVYALARLLEVFEDGSGTVAHGDLSTKNVLWSLRDGPAVYVIDCDGSRRFDAEGTPLDGGPRPHVTTPNWDDPAAGTGEITPLADRYSLALIFLRVVGAAHYPIQARQKKGERLVIDVEIPPWGRRAQRLSRDSEVWDLVSRGLGVRDTADRPTAGEWRVALEAALRELSARHLVEAVQRRQGETDPVLAPLADQAEPVARPEREVTVRGRAAEVRPEQFSARPVPTWRPHAGDGDTAPVWRPPGAPGKPLIAGPSGRSGGPSAARQHVGTALGAWWLLHRRAALALRTPGRRGLGVRRSVLCAVTDFVTACFGLFLVAMIVSPFLGI